MAITTYDGLIAQVGADKSINEFFYQDQQSALTGTTVIASSINQIVKHCFNGDRGTWRALPNPFPGTVTGYMITNCEVVQTGAACQMLIGRLHAFGDIDIGTNSFSDDDPMPTVTSLGASYQIPSAVLCVTTTALNATPGNLTVTYIDQDNNTAESTSALAMTASSSVNAASWLPLNSGDWGVLDITNVVQSGGTTPSGVIRLYGFIPLGITQSNSSLAYSLNLTTGFPHFFKYGEGDEFLCVVIGTSTAKGAIGKMTVIGVE